MPESPPASTPPSQTLIRTLCLVALLMAEAPAGATGQIPSDTVRVTIQGTVVDAGTGFGIEGALLRFADTDFSTETNVLGGFSLSGLPRGAYVIVVEAAGYSTRKSSIRVLRSGLITLSLEPDGSLLRSEMRPSEAQSRVLGQILEMESGDPVQGAEVLLQGAPGFRVTDSEGRFEFPSVQPGMAALTVVYLGRAPLADSVEVAPGTTVELEVRLGVEPVEMDPLSVIATPRNSYLEDMGFYSRIGRGYTGKMITREQIQERAPRTLGDLLVSVPGVRVVFGGSGRFEVRMRRGVRLDSSAEVGCVPLVYLDDVPVEAGWLQNVRPDRIEGLEVYQGTGAPIQYNNPCGAILVWTRRGGEGGS